MSIQFGCISLNGEPVDPVILDNMSMALADYQYDTYTKFAEKKVAMGFYNQFVTIESENDSLPFYDKETGLFFICDAILDNRDELIDILKIEKSGIIPDSRIVFEAYKKWRKECAKYLLGDFAFVIYDENAKQITLFRDHMGKRLIYYRILNNMLFFATLLKPLIDPYKKNSAKELSEQYLVEFLSIADIRHEMTPGLTIYKDIYYVLPGGLTSVSCGIIKNIVYWDPAKIRVNQNYNQENYIEEFRRIFFDAVRCRLRTSGKIGILLSGGLDSSSVACVAASILKDQGKNLNTYTSVPKKEFTNYAPPYYIVDESLLVKQIGVSYPNMKMQFIDSKWLNSINVIDQVMTAVEQPYKFVENSYWLNEIFGKASQDGCKIILDGTFGNSTISNGMFDTILTEHILRFDLGRFWRDFNSFCLNNMFSRKRVLLALIRNIIKFFFHFNKEEFASPVTKSEYRKKYGIERKMRSVGYTSSPFTRFRNQQLFALDPTARNHIATPNTKTGLIHNICERDPTSDKRIVEYCLQLPYYLFFYPEKGLDRGLIRQSMNGIVPSVILDNFRYRGLQAADWQERITDDWNQVISELKDSLLSKNSMLDYVDTNYLIDLINRTSIQDHSFDVTHRFRDILMVYIYIRFLESLQ